jgi:hypothetical protein
MPVDVDAAVKNALERRTDLQQTQRSLEVTDVNIRFFRNQTLPDVSANVNYGLQGIGGSGQTQVIPGAPIGTPTVVQKSYGSVLQELFAQDFPSWTAQLNISYQPRTYPPAIHPDADAAQEPATAGDDAGASAGAQRPDQPAARAKHPGVAGAR